MFSRFFIERPVFANVIAIITVIFGLVTVYRLPVEEYPEITPPTVQVTTTYPGASAQVVADTVGSPIEEQVNGVENMLYMSSTSASDGSYTLTVTFDVGTNTDLDQVLVQNRVAAAVPLFPAEVQLEGLVTQKQSTDIVLFVTLTSPDKRFDSLFLSNYATINLLDELARLPGVGQTRVVGAGTYSMRMWLDSDKLTARNLTTQDVRQCGPGAERASRGRDHRRAADKDQARVPVHRHDAGPADDACRIRQHHHQGGAGCSGSNHAGQGRGPRRARRANLRSTFRGQRQASRRHRHFSTARGQCSRRGQACSSRKWISSKSRFPQGLVYDIPFDTTKFVSAAINEVYWTLGEAGALVLLVILLFLQDWRAILVPATTVPVTIIGAFAAMYALGFTINLLTMFGLILAIGIVVDDAIVIVENASHHIEAGLPPKQATIKAMSELLGPIIGITLVLTAVFLPASFLGGITGQLYRQFALTIAATAVISAINALTLKPAQCAHLPAADIAPAEVHRVPRVQCGLRSVGKMVRRSQRLGRAPYGDHDGGFRRAAEHCRLGIFRPAHRLSADRRSRLFHHQRPIARRGVARSNRKNHR